MATTAAAVPAVRNGLIGKIHVAKKQLALSDESYRALLKRATGKESCTDMDLGELEAVLTDMKRVGFKPRPKTKKKSMTAIAKSHQARKIRAFWLMLHNLGEIQDSSEEALGAFVGRTTKVESLQWLTTDQADQAIKALRGWLERVGYYHPKAIDRQVFGDDGRAENISLMHLQAEILGIKDIYGWLNKNGFPCDSLMQMDRNEMYAVIKILGQRIRDKKKANHV